MVMLALPLCVAAAAAAAFAPLGGMEMDSTSYVITWANKTSGWCVDLTGGSTANGTEVQLWDCNGLKNQQWLMDTTEGTIRSAVDPTKCLDNLGGSTAPGNRIGIWDCEAGDESQQWSYDSTTQTLNLTSAGGVCLDLPGGTPVNGNWLEVWGCNGLVNQDWTLQKPSDMPVYCETGHNPPDTCPGGSVCPACGRLVCPCPAGL